MGSSTPESDHCDDHGPMSQPVSHASGACTNERFQARRPHLSLRQHRGVGSGEWLPVVKSQIVRFRELKLRSRVSAARLS